jgi:hypothetical protein
MRSLRAPWALALAPLCVIAACGGKEATSTACPVGDERCACTSGGACNPGLVCLSNTCVRLPGAGNDASSGFSNRDAASGSDTDSSGTDADDGASSTLADARSVDAGDDASGVLIGEAGPPPTCATGSGWSCAVNPNCGASPTSLSGQVFDPAGKNPLYNVIVFVPDDPGKLPIITPGTRSCNTCDAPIGKYVAAAVTDATGSFTLQGVPTGPAVPIVVQIGKWRRLLQADTADCATTTLPKGALRLPRSRREGDMPQMALLTGGCDDLGCLLYNIGIDASEFSAPRAGGRLDVYQGLASVGSAAGLSNGVAGDCTGTSCPLWSSKQDLEYYDMVALSCECAENAQTKPAAAMQALHDWLDEGGRVFASHFQYTWFKNGPIDFQGVATWLGGSTAAGQGTYNLDTTFPKGAAFQQWLVNVGAATGSTIALSAVASSVSTVNPPAARLIYDAANGNAAKQLSFPTPIGGIPAAADAATNGRNNCGKAAFSDLHASSSLLSTVGSIPAGCSAAALTPQQNALEFVLFDLTACIDNHPYPPHSLP